MLTPITTLPLKGRGSGRNASAYGFVPTIGMKGIVQKRESVFVSLEILGEERSPSPFKGEARWGMGVSLLIQSVPIPTLALPLKGRECDVEAIVGWLIIKIIISQTHGSYQKMP
jgi:hypothetical protein